MRGFLWILVLSLLVPLCTSAQDGVPPTDVGFRWSFDTRFGSEPELGFRVPSTSFGSSIEYPLGNQLELQGGVIVTPTETANGAEAHWVEIEGTGIARLTTRLGLSFGVRREWLWAGQTQRSGWNPMLGVVLRDQLLRPGRLSVAYLFPTGCGERVSSCSNWSGRTQGMELTQEFRLWPHFRVGLRGGIYHYCELNESSGHGDCKFSPGGEIIMRFEFSKGSSQISY
ncbi:MAG TPA: hypothetical protein VMP68_18255 [Candidatus Eisenbacteria bacterium]|nr:hypothetical protein [Candidatus Eisenbacteria bacterium]